MAGLYIHVPFCKQACTYCDFHFSTATKGRERVLSAMHRELDQRMNELSASPVASIYFGGGTPSLLEPLAIRAFIDQVRSNATVAPEAEITLEVNPDDVEQAALDAWLDAGITRVSLGTQSFRDERLRWMGRAHNAEQALRSIALIARTGFTSWTIDLIYGLPRMTPDEWDEQITIALEHGMPHLSAYCLTIEEGTVLHRQVTRGQVAPANDGEQSAQFDQLMDRMEAAGLQHYEISNFGRPDHLAVHNLNYWRGVPYVGIGPSAHSFDGAVRRWNVANNQRYLRAVEMDRPFQEQERLTELERRNERLLTGLRTMWGVDLREVLPHIPASERSRIDRAISDGHARIIDERLILTRRGMHFADRIASDLFILPSKEHSERK